MFNSLHEKKMQNIRFNVLKNEQCSYICFAVRTKHGKYTKLYL